MCVLRDGVGWGAQSCWGQAWESWTLLDPKEWENRIRRGHTQDPGTGLGSKVLGLARPWFP